MSAVGVALAGLATATGLVQIRDGFLDGRIYSTFQYPNALASYLAAATLTGLYLWRRAGTPGSNGKVVNSLIKGMPNWLTWTKLSPYLYAAGNFLLFAVLLGTKSNGGLMVFFLSLCTLFHRFTEGKQDSCFPPYPSFWHTCLHCNLALSIQCFRRPAGACLALGHCRISHGLSGAVPIQ